MAELKNVDKRLIYCLSGDIGDSLTPFAELAVFLGVSEEDILGSIRSYVNSGLIRRFGATLWHQKSGFSANAMIVFSVPQDRAIQCGESLAQKPFVSHCYLRRTAPGWPFNLYAMTHAENREQLLAMAEEMANQCSADKWRMLESLKELKKASLRYFADPTDK